ncbi:MAG: alpha/beta hydrolase family protein, partial [Solimonas sp.]
QGIADPRRVAIVGWSFGGYIALLGATRNSDLYRCAVSVAGISDLLELRAQERNFIGGDIAVKEIGTDRDKLREDSPRRHAAGVRIPVLLAHGTLDANVEYEQSDIMASALKRAGKDYELITFKKADHQLWRPEERRRLFGAIETFLARNMAPLPAPPATASAPP